MKNLLSEELYKIKYLGNFDRSKILSEQQTRSNDKGPYELGSNVLFYSDDTDILNLRDESGNVSNLNGIFEDFRINVETKEITPNGFERNNEFCEFYWGKFNRDNRPPNYNEKFDFKFLAKKTQGRNASLLGKMFLFAGTIKELDKEFTKNSLLTEVDGPEIGPNEFTKVGTIFNYKYYYLSIQNGSPFIPGT